MALVFWVCFWAVLLLEDSQRWLPRLFKSLAPTGLTIAGDKGFLFGDKGVVVAVGVFGDKGGLVGVLAKLRLAFDL